MPDVQKMCILSFDELHIKTQLQYLSASGSVVGLENFGQEHPPRPAQKPASESLCFMVRSIAGKWKQMLGYFFSSSSTPSDILHVLVLTALQHHTECGLKVVGVVCDQGPTNQRLFSQLGVSPERPFFVFGKSTIFALFDPPHLLKSTRNILPKYNIRFGGSKKAKWSAIEYFYAKDSRNVYKVAPKLTNQHINVENKMRVKLAAQVLSHSVAMVARRGGVLVPRLAPLCGVLRCRMTATGGARKPSPIGFSGDIGGYRWSACVESFAWTSCWLVRVLP